MRAAMFLLMVLCACSLSANDNVGLFNIKHQSWHDDHPHPEYAHHGGFIDYNNWLLLEGVTDVSSCPEHTVAGTQWRRYTATNVPYAGENRAGQIEWFLEGGQLVE